MKIAPFLASVLLLSTSALRAESTLTLEGVHNCCKKCADGITSAVAKVEGASATAEKGTVKITAKDDATLQKAAASLLANGYFGKGAPAPAIAGQAVKSATVEGVHLCCGKCVTAAEKAVTSVKGVTSHTAEKGAKSFKVEGDFNTKELAQALNNAGFNGFIK
jgi:copper chaperone CopZ